MYAGFRLVPKSVTVNDLRVERHDEGCFALFHQIWEATAFNQLIVNVCQRNQFLAIYDLM